MANVGIGDIRQIVDDVVKLYKQFKYAHEQRDAMGDDMKMLRAYLSDLTSFLDKHPKLNRDYPSNYDNLKQTLKELHRAAREVLTIFKEWDDNDKFFAHLMLAFGSNPDRLRKLSERIRGLRSYLRDWMQLMQTQMLVKVVPETAARKRVQPPDRPKSVLFLDNFDSGRAVIGQCYAQLLQHLTQGKQHPWPLSLLHSAGVRVKGDGNVATAQEALKMQTSLPGVNPLGTALDALFHNNAFAGNYKHSIWTEAKKHPARSLKDHYAKYDYVVVFDDYIKRGFEQITAFLEQNHQAKPMKGKLVHLADYHPNSQVRNISKGLQQGNVRDRWNKTSGQIKVAFKRFLTQELGWQQPHREEKQRG